MPLGPPWYERWWMWLRGFWQYHMTDHCPLCGGVRYAYRGGVHYFDQYCQVCGNDTVPKRLWWKRYVHIMRGREL